MLNSFVGQLAACFDDKYRIFLMIPLSASPFPPPLCGSEKAFFFPQKAFFPFAFPAPPPTFKGRLYQEAFLEGFFIPRKTF